MDLETDCMKYIALSMLFVSYIPPWLLSASYGGSPSLIHGSAASSNVLRYLLVLRRHRYGDKTRGCNVEGLAPGQEWSPKATHS
jgi:hypothetical protein